MKLIGIAQALLLNISLIAGMNDPQLKISPVGFLQMLLENNAMTQINNLEELQAGQNIPVKLRYLERGLESAVSDTDDCDTPVTPSWKEAEITHPLYSQIGIFISDVEMRKYEKAATETMQITNGGVNAGALSVPVMRAMYEMILTHIQPLVQKMDANLLTAQSAKWGVNVVTGARTATTINISETASMDDGIVKLITDAEANEISDDLLICGNGYVHAFDVYNKLKTGTDKGGFGALNLNAYVDPKSTSKWGANKFGVFGKGMVGLVDWNKNVGSYAGEKGGSVFFTIPVPVQLANGVLSTLVFDAQLKYVDCPQTDSEGGTIGRGYKLIISKNYGLFNAPEYRTGDPLAGVNGSLQYVATHTA